jgi:hypothetical protein
MVPRTTSVLHRTSSSNELKVRRSPTIARVSGTTLVCTGRSVVAGAVPSGLSLSRVGATGIGVLLVTASLLDAVQPVPKHVAATNGANHLTPM